MNAGKIVLESRLQHGKHLGYFICDGTLRDAVFFGDFPVAFAVEPV